MNNLDQFRQYLERKGYAPNTIRQYINYAGLFLEWIHQEELQADHVRYNDLLVFIHQLKEKNLSTSHINRVLLSIRYYYYHLSGTGTGAGNQVTNPAANLHLKGTIRRVVHDVVSFTDLERIFTNYRTKDHRDKRNKVILGVLIYQGLTTEELHRLEVGHVDLQNGRLYVPGNRRRNSRTLPLYAVQVLDMEGYIKRIRPRLVKMVGFGSTDQLFISMEGSLDLKSSLHHMFRRLKRIYPEIKSAGQIRQSVITHWLKTHNLREVQYMAGHRWVSSTERYQQNNLEDLQKDINRNHPLKF
jgi:integrase/recombinase XerD